jgi:O-antigen ligase
MTVRNWAAFASLTVVLCFATLNNGGVDRSAWHWSLLFVGLIGCFHFVFRSSHPEPRLDNFALITGGLFFVFAVIQLVPLPIGLVHVLSPARADLLRGAQPFIVPASKLVTLSAVPDETAECLMTFAGYALIALTIRSLTLRFNGSPWITSLPILFAASMEALLGFSQAIGGPADAVATGTYPDHDQYAGLLELALPFAAMFPVGILQRESICHEAPAARAIQVCIFLAIAGSLVAGIIQSQSRIGLIASFAALIIAGLLTFLLRGWSVDYEVSEGWLRKWLSAAVIALVVMLGFLILPTEPLIARFSLLAATGEVSSATRMEIWRDTTDIIESYPLFGCGLGGYESCLLRYKTTAPMARIASAQNDYLQLLAELGFFGFLAGLLFVLWTLHRAVKGARYAQSIEGRCLAIACVASIAAMLLHSFVGVNLYAPVNGMVFAWIIGIAGIYLHPSRSVKHSLTLTAPAERLENPPRHSEFRTLPGKSPARQ